MHDVNHANLVSCALPLMRNRVTETGRQVLLPRTPVTFALSQCELERHTLRKKLMTNPIPRIRFPVEHCALDADVLVRRIEIDISDRGRLIGLRIGDLHRFEEGRIDEVDALAGIGEEAHHTPG